MENTPRTNGVPSSQHKMSTSQGALAKDGQQQQLQRQRDPTNTDLRDMPAPARTEAREKAREAAASMPSKDQQSILERLCAPGYDPEFDIILSNLARVTRDRPKALVEDMITWRNHQYSSNAQAVSGQQEPRSTSNSRVVSAAPSPDPVASSPPPFQPHSIGTMTEDPRARISTYILLRVLIEIFSTATVDSLGLDTVRKVQNIVFKHQLLPYAKDRKTGLPHLEKTAETATRWDLAARVWGLMSCLDFHNVQELLLQELRALQATVSLKTPSERVADYPAEKYLRQLLKGMRYIRLPTKVESEWIKASEFMLAVADLFSGVHGQSAKTSYTKFIGQILLPVAADVPPYVEHLAWHSVYSKLYDRLSKLGSNAKYAPQALPALAILNCLAPADAFETRWRDLVSGLPGKLRERTNRAAYLKSVCRLLWVRLRRTHSTNPLSTKTLEEVTKQVFFSGKKISLSSEPAIAEPLIELIRIVADANQDFCFQKVIFPLLNSDLLLNHKVLNVSDLDPDRTVIGIKAFLVIASDVEEGSRPPFPAHFQDERESTPVDRRGYALTNGTPPRSHTRNVSIFRDDRLSRPMPVTLFSDDMRVNYDQFCEILGKITRICNNSHGGEAVINQQVSSSATLAAKPALVETAFFKMREDPSVNDKAAYYDLLHTAIQALPQCPSPAISNIEMVTLLCFGVAHSQRKIAKESSSSLASFARQGQAHLVVQRFTHFIFNYDTRYSTLSDSGMLGPDFIEQTLGLYLKLLQIWIDEVLAKARGAKDDSDLQIDMQKGPKLDTSSTWQLVDRVEAHGLLFLCSPSPKVRRFATQVLELVPKFDDALGKENARIYHTLERTDLRSQRIDKDILTTYERSILDRRANKLQGWQDVFIRLCNSAEQADCIFWNKIFPHLARAINDECPVAVAQTRNDVCARLVQMQPVIEFMGHRGQTLSQPDATTPRLFPQQFLTSSNITIDQWRNYLTFACATLSSLRAEPRSTSDAGTTKSAQIEKSTSASKPLANGMESNSIPSSTPAPGMLAKTPSLVSQPASLTETAHARSSSKSSSSNNEPMDLGNELLGKVSPLLYVENSLVRDAASTGLGAINKHLFRPLVESLAISARKHDDIIERPGPLNSPVGAHRRIKSTCMTEVAQVYSLTAHYLREPEFLQDDFIMETVSVYVNTLLGHLRDIEPSLEMWKLRRFFCDLVEQVYRASGFLPDKSRYISFQTRKVIFVTLEEWYSSITDQWKERVPSQDRKEMGKVAIAALSAMSTLCAGPLSMRIGNTTSDFNHEKILKWADRLLNNDADKQQKFGQQALINTVLNNRGNPKLLERIVHRLYTSTKAKAIASYLDVIAKVMSASDAPRLAFCKILGALLFVLGNSDRSVRMHAARMLRSLDESQGVGSAKLRDLDISISDKTMVVYKRAQFEIASKLAESHPGLAMQLVSELSHHFVELAPEYQRNLVSVILPWLRKVNLQLEPLIDGSTRPTDQSYMVLVNLLQITVRCSKTLHTEVQALWQTLVTGEQKGNLKLIIDFVIDLCLDRRDQTCLDCAKQVVVYLATAKADQSGKDYTENVIDFLTLSIRPQRMVTETRSTLRSLEASGLFFVADLVKEFPFQRDNRLSYGHVCLVLLVDLISLPLELESERLSHLLVAVFTLWDMDFEYFREQVREMLIHLIQSLVISKAEADAFVDNSRHMEDLVDLVRDQDSRVTWTTKEGLTYDAGEELPAGMSYLVPRMLEIFERTNPQIRNGWAHMTLNWAVECAVPHLACRSLQLHRCSLQTSKQSDITDVLVRLAVAASDPLPNMQQYSTELLRVCRQMVTSETTLERLLMAQLFWAICATLDSAQEMDFREALTVLDLLLPKMSLADPDNVDLLLRVCPADWEWTPLALTGLVYKGLTSSDSYDKSLAILNKLVQLPSNAITGDDARTLRVILANLPSLIHFAGQPRDHPEYTETARLLGQVCAARDMPVLSSLLLKYTKLRYQSDFDFLTRVAAAICRTQFPRAGAEVLMCLTTMLANPTIWLKKEILVLQKVILSATDVRQIDFDGHGRDILWPLYVTVRTTQVMTEALDVIELVNDVRNDIGRPHIEFYGTPADNGWSVQDPTESRLRVRRNLRRLHDKYSPPLGNNLPEDDRTPEMGRLQTSRTELPTFPDLMSAEQVMATLEEVDDFFDTPDTSGGYMTAHRRLGSRAPLSGRGSQGSGLHSRTYSNAYADTSVASSPSIRSRADSRPTPPREPAVMSPSAFTSSPRTRPGMGQRSITSPAGSIDRTPPGRGPFLPAPSPDDGEPFSDDDLVAGRTSTSDLSTNGAIRPSSRTKQSFRSGVRSISRRLTGGRRQYYEQSPDVPQIPKQYVPHYVPQSSDL